MPDNDDFPGSDEWANKTVTTLITAGLMNNDTPPLVRVLWGLRDPRVVVNPRVDWLDKRVGEDITADVEPTQILDWPMHNYMQIFRTPLGFAGAPPMGNNWQPSIEQLKWGMNEHFRSIEHNFFFGKRTVTERSHQLTRTFSGGLAFFSPRIPQPYGPLSSRLVNGACKYGFGGWLAGSNMKYLFGPEEWLRKFYPQFKDLGQGAEVHSHRYPHPRMRLYASPVLEKDVFIVDINHLLRLEFAKRPTRLLYSSSEWVPGDEAMGLEGYERHASWEFMSDTALQVNLIAAHRHVEFI